MDIKCVLNHLKSKTKYDKNIMEYFCITLWGFSYERAIVIKPCANVKTESVTDGRKENMGPVMWFL